MATCIFMHCHRGRGMPDLADHADPLIALFQAAAEQRARGKSGPQSHPDFDGLHCVQPDCGAEIPAGRLALGRVRCVECQGLKERGRP